MRRTLGWLVVLSLILVGVVLIPCLSGAQDDQKFPILLSTGIPAADVPEDVLPAGAMVYLRINNAQTLLENLDSLLTTIVPEKAVPPEMQPFLEKPQPFIAFLGMQAFGQELMAANLSDITGIALNRPASIALYPLPQTKGLVISLPVANASIVSQMVESILTPEAFEKGNIGDITYYHVTPPSYKIPTDLYILASDTTIFFCGSVEVAEMLANAGNMGLLVNDPVIPKAITKYGSRDLTLILSPGMFKEQLPAMQAQLAEILTPVFLQIRAHVQQMPAEERLLLDARLRLQFGIDGLDQLVDYGEAYATGIYRVVFDRFITLLTDLDGLAVALDLDKEFQTAALSFFSQGIKVEQLPRPLPVEDVKKALNVLPGEKGIVVALGQAPEANASPLATAILEAIEAELQAKGLPMDTFSAIKAFQKAKQHQTPLSAKSAWMLKTIAPLADKFDFSQFNSLEALLSGVSRWAAAQPMAMSVTVMPAMAAGVLEQYFTEQAQIITQNGQNYQALRDKLPFQQPIFDSRATFRQEDAGAGLQKFTLDHIYTTRNGFFGYQQHAWINRRILLHQQKDGYDVLYATGADLSRVKPIIEGQPAAAPGALTALFDRAPSGALAASTFRILHGVLWLLDALTGIEEVAHRELDVFLAKTQEIVKTSGPEDLAAKLLDAKLAPPMLLMSLNLDGEGNVYAVLPGGLHYPRPVIMPKAKELFTDFLASAPAVGGMASFVAAQSGEVEFSAVQSTAGLALLVKTVVNAFYDAYMTTPEGQEQLFSTLMHPSDFQPIEEEEIFVNPLWESLKTGEGLPFLSEIERSKQARTIADMKSIGTALGFYQVDQNYYPQHPEAMYLWDIELPSDYYEGSYSDGWEMPFTYLSDAEGQNYLLLSYGKDGMPGSESGGAFDADIIYMNGMFIAPEKIAGGVMEAELNSALLLAVQANSYDIVDAVLMSGADPDAQTAEGQSALAIATELEFSDIVDLLTEAGATE